MTFRILIPGVLIALAGLATPAFADTPGALPSVSAPAPVPGSFADETLSGPGGIYRIIATSAGVLLGAGAMSLIIDGLVVDIFQQTGGLTAVESFEIVQDHDSQGGFEAAAVVLSGLAGGLMADSLYVKTAKLMPGVLESVNNTFEPPAAAASAAWLATTRWTGARIGDASDWVQARSQEWTDRWQQWTDTLRASWANPGHTPR